MNVPKLLLFLLLGWTLIGISGMLLSLARHERAKLIRGLKSLIGVWVAYFALVIGVSLVQRQRTLSIGQPQCFDKLCFAVLRVDDIPRFSGRNPQADDSHLIRVTIQARNIGRDGPQKDSSIQAYLIDSQGRRWEESRGVNGNLLTGVVEQGSEIVCEPVFRVAGDATSLKLIFTHGRWQSRVFTFGDSDSLFHRRTVFVLGK